ncbi:MAG: ABC transporter permease [Ignavibacteria bacterium]|nr:ABC transporter permease [Ignavibacteria bacterium]
MSIKRINAIIIKEFKQLLRDKRYLFVLFFFPVFLLGMFGYAVNFDVKNIKLAVMDNDNSKESREFIKTLISSEYFILSGYIEKDSDIKPMLDNQDVQLILVVPQNFSTELAKNNGKPSLQFLVDGVNGNTALIINNYITSAAMNFNAKIQTGFAEKAGITSLSPINFQPRFWFNPSLETTKYLIPGLIAMILIVTAVVSVSLSLVREKERGTIEQIKVSSVNTIEMLLGKAVPYVCIAMLNGILVLIAGMLLFNLEIQGSYLLLLLTTSIFLLAGIILGIFVSVVADSQQVAFTIAVFLSFLPSFILSGFVFPIDSMPPIIQIITNITPAKFFVAASRSIILKGAGVSAIYDQLMYLILYTLFFLILAVLISIKKEKEL